MRAFLTILLLGALAAPAAAHDRCGHHRHGQRHGHGHGHRSHVSRSHTRPYWHHPYYARFGYQRPYLYYRQLRTYGHVPYARWGGYGGLCFRAYYPAFVTVAPLYSRLGVALTLADAAFARPDRDGLPRARTGPVGSRFLGDIG